MANRQVEYFLAQTAPIVPPTDSDGIAETFHKIVRILEIGYCTLTIADKVRFLLAVEAFATTNLHKYRPVHAFATVREVLQPGSSFKRVNTLPSSKPANNVEKPKKRHSYHYLRR